MTPPAKLCFTLGGGLQMKNIVIGLLAAIPLVVQAASFDVAHIREQGQDMIVFPMNSSIDYKSDQQRREIMFSLQRCASSARLAGIGTI